MALQFLIILMKPNCESKGFTEHYCNVCRTSYIDKYTEPLGHEYSHTVKHPTCTLIGYTLHKCSRCGDSYTDNKTSPKGHKWGDWITVNQPSETSKGEAIRSCSVCDASELVTPDELSTNVHSWTLVSAVYKIRHYAVCPHCNVYLCELDDDSDPDAALWAHIEASGGDWYNHSWANTIESILVEPAKWKCAKCGAEKPYER